MPRDPGIRLRGIRDLVSTSIDPEPVASYSWTSSTTAPTISPSDFNTPVDPPPLRHDYAIPPNSVEGYINEVIIAPMTGEYRIYSYTNSDVSYVYATQGEPIHRGYRCGVTLYPPNQTSITLITTGNNNFTEEGESLFRPLSRTSSTSTANIPELETLKTEVNNLKTKLEEQTKLIQFLVDTLNDKGLLV